jgi:hypothetical protein
MATLTMMIWPIPGSGAHLWMRAKVVFSLPMDYWVSPLP